MTTWIFLAIAAYAIVAVLCYGVFFAYWQREYALSSRGNKVGDAVMSALFALVWPIGVPGAFTGLGFKSPFSHGLKFNWQDEYHPSHASLDRWHG